MGTSIFFVITLLILLETPDLIESISYETVKIWADDIGFQLSGLGDYITQVKKFHESYKEAEVKPRDGSALVQEISKDIEAMMESKISAIKRIMDVAETSALSSPNVDPPESFLYINAKNNTVDMEFSTHFGGSVNLNMSAVHVPTNVYDRKWDVIRAIKWSEELDKTFINNFEQDPSLSWQYFGSSTGFMRQYPATSWYTEEVDLFDCRTRSWYIEAATSPKDILILIDTSGSMTGVKKEIARHVVNNILDTLGNNDFVNIITFSNVTTEVVPCFNDTLIQANLANVRELKKAISNLKTEMIANFSLALDKAFELLETYRTEKEGARCNQAIMLITDGVPYNYKEIFQFYNWRDNPHYPEKADMPVRMFTYLIGRESSEVREVNWMACANRGYYVQLCTLAEVREEVLKYVHVMARPLVLNRTIHPTVWTPVYADITDPKMTDWLWEERQSKEQMERFLMYRRNKKLFSEEQDRRFVKKQRTAYGQADQVQAYKLMTSVSMPVYDRRENGNITRRVLVNEAYWVTETRESRIAELLGVAGTDVPIEQIQKLMMPHMLGVNGYAFVVTNNGFILIHPDLRPVFQGILKPAYNSVDMAEVELIDNDKGPRDFDEGLIKLREFVVEQANGSVTLLTKFHYDDMQRVGRVRRKYDYMPIAKTPFTLVVSLPEYESSTGNYRIHATEEIHRYLVNKENVTTYFAGNNWRVHPHWMYCEYHFEDGHRFNSPEALLLHFLERTRQPRWKWSDMKQRSQPPEYSAASSSHGSHPNPYKADRSSYYCDRNLLLSLVYDAKVTEWFANPSASREETGDQRQQRFGVTVAFMATHSGLTRWLDFPLNEDVEITKDHFSKMHLTAIDEVWYKRAVEQHYVDPKSFVFSVSTDAGADNDTLVTASHAVFIGNNTAKAPAAVVGFQFQHTALQAMFQRITFNCSVPKNCEKHCGDEAWACYLIDNNGYIIAAEEEEDAGRFFGEVRGPIMSNLVERKIYDRIRIFDYQAVCFKSKQNKNNANILVTPWRTIERTAAWLFGQVAWIWAKAGIWNSEYAEAYAYPNEEDEVHDDYQENDVKAPIDTKVERTFDQKVLINRTRPEACDQEVYLYLLRNVQSKTYDVNADLGDKRECPRPYVVQPVKFTNMLLIVVNTLCENTISPPLSVVPEEIIYENTSLVCHKALAGLSRKKPQSCIRSHPRENEIKNLCGSAVLSTLPNFYLLLIPLLSCVIVERIIISEYIYRIY